MENNTFYATLSNGLRIVHRQTSSPVVYLGIMVGCGTRDESEKENGMAHFIEHCVFKGTEKHSARQIIERVEGIGGEINAYTTKEETAFYAATLTSHFSKTVQLLSEMVFMPTFPEKEIEKERSVIMDEIESYNDSPSELIYDDFENLVFAGHSLQRPILGTKKTLRTFNSDKAKQFMACHYRPEKMVFFSQGDLSFNRVKMYAEKFLNSQNRGPVSLERMPFTPTMKHSHVIYNKHTHQVHIMMGVRAFPLGHENQIPLFLLNNILGGGSLNSRLNLALREKRGLVYTIESTYTPLSDTGYWSVYFATESQNKDYCIDLVLQELDSIKQTLIRPDLLHRYKLQLQGQMAISAQNQENNALAMAKQVLYFNEAPLWQSTFAKANDVTAHQIQDIANMLFQTGDIQYVEYL